MINNNVHLPNHDQQIVHVMEKPVMTPEQAAEHSLGKDWKITNPQESKPSMPQNTAEQNKNNHLAVLGGRAEDLERKRRAQENKAQNKASLENKTTTNKGIEAARQKAAEGKTAQTGKSDNQGIKSFQSKASGESTGSVKSGAESMAKGSSSGGSNSKGSSNGQGR